MTERCLVDLDRHALTRLLERQGKSRFRALQIWQAVYRELVPDYSHITTLPVSLRKSLAEKLPLSELQAVDELISQDKKTRKILFRLHDDAMIETVLMQYKGRNTACISTQVGCPIGCSFCATGKSGFTRNLSPGEIVGQVLHVERGLRKQGMRLSNVVYMGMGEPFLNYEASLYSIRILNDEAGFSLGARRFTVSTVGIVPGIERLTDEGLQVNLAVSLHAANDTLRDELIPTNRLYPLSTLLNACREYINVTHRRITYEYVLILGINDTLRHARELVELIGGSLCHVNLIPLNPVFDSPYRTSTPGQITAFAAELKKAHISTTVRLSKGGEIQAGCGQLRRRRSTR
ncbi:MAG: 23S rRNA (adenine(2503)-C(2))-methyltransferase RlmN [Candidatus Bipolaricaulota bacterium]|nr:23S rRNA (adenine(2503)-C(2))-methyltransferase RlmN [Candidatus Bipolaricaulota bacterium]